jgi:hypothetical protein
VIKAISIADAARHSYHVNIVKEVIIEWPAGEYFKTMVWL